MTTPNQAKSDTDASNPSRCPRRPAGSPARRRRWQAPTAVLACIGLAGAAAACGTSTPNASGSAGTKRTAAIGANTTTACQSWVALDQLTNQAPGGPQGPPSGSQVKQFASELKPVLTRFVSTAPATPMATAKKMLGFVNQALQSGDPSVIFPDQNHALDNDLTAVERWVHGTCGFQSLNAEGVDNVYRGVPQSLEAGVVSIAFTNKSTHGRDHEFQVLAIRPGSGLDAATLIGALKADPNKAQQTYGNDVEPVADTGAPPGQTGYTTAELKPGVYLVASFAGNPPDVTKGMITSFTVR